MASILGNNMSCTLEVAHVSERERQQWCILDDEGYDASLRARAHAGCFCVQNLYIMCLFNQCKKAC